MLAGIPAGLNARVAGYGTSEEVSRRVGPTWCASSAGKRAADRGDRGRSRDAHRDAEQEVRQAQADSGERPDSPSSTEREEIHRLTHELRRANERLKSASELVATEVDTDRAR